MDAVEDFLPIVVVVLICCHVDEAAAAPLAADDLPAGNFEEDTGMKVSVDELANAPDLLAVDWDRRSLHHHTTLVIEVGDVVAVTTPEGGMKSGTQELLVALAEVELWVTLVGEFDLLLIGDALPVVLGHDDHGGVEVDTVEGSGDDVVSFCLCAAEHDSDTKTKIDE